MGDSLGMTIEFLRARLLSERSVSRTARQRADQLAKRVAELEEQLRIVTIQRKKAEKAAAEVLAILERQGIGEFSEVIDSSSDHDEVAGGPKESNSKANGDGSSTASRVNGSEVDDDGYSTSELEVSASQTQGKSLSWKSNRNGNPPGKRRQYQARHGSTSSGFMYNCESSRKAYLGKSCRKIKRSDKGESGSEVGNRCTLGSENDKNVPHATCGMQLDDSVDDCLEGKQRSLDGASGIKRDSDGTMSSYPLDEQVEYLNAKVGVIDIGKDEDMERALEKQAKLINQYQAEENAQREWEEQFSKADCNLGHIQEDTGMLADDSEEMIKLDTDMNLPDNGLCHDDEKKHGESSLDLQNGISNAKKNCDSGSKSCIHDNTERANPICKESSMPSVGSSSNASTLHVNFHGSSGPMANVTINAHRAHPRNIQGQGTLSENSDVIPNGGWNQLSCIDGFHENTAVDIPAPGLSGLESSKSQAPESQKLFAEPPGRSPHHGLGGVLDALHHAKLSLMKEMSKMSEPTHPLLLATADSHVALAKQSNIAGIPTSTAGLFRLPTDPLPSSDKLGSGRYLLGSDPPEMSGSDRNLLITPSSGYRHMASSEFQSRLSVRKWEVDSHSRSGSGISPPIGRRVPHFHADSTMFGSLTSYGTHRPYVSPQTELFPTDRYSNGMDFRGIL